MTLRDKILLLFLNALCVLVFDLLFSSEPFFVNVPLALRCLFALFVSVIFFAWEEATLALCFCVCLCVYVFSYIFF